MVTLLQRPQGHKLTGTDLDATVGQSSGEALFTTAFAHGLVDGDWIYVLSNIESYNGFKVVDQTAYNEFKIKNSENDDPILWKQDATATYQVSVLDHGFQCVHLPIVYELESDLFPTNVAEEAYTPVTVVSQSDSNGYTRLALSTGISGLTALNWIKIGEDVYRILIVNNPWNIVIDLAYDASNIFSGAVLNYYNNYCINVLVYAGLPGSHPWEEEKPYELAATLQLTPDENNLVKFSINEILRGYIQVKNNLTLDTLPNNIDAAVAFYIEYFESYDDSDGEEISTTEGTHTADEFEGWAINAKLPFKEGSYLNDYVNFDTYVSEWLVLQPVPIAIVGRFFDASFINTRNEGDLLIFKNGDQIDSITNPGTGVIRLPLEFSQAEEACIVVKRAAIPGFTPDTMDAIDTWTNIDTGGPAWAVSGGVPEIDFDGLGLSIESDDWHTDYAFEAGQSYSFNYSLKGSNSAGIFHIEIVNGSNVMITELQVPTNPELQAGNYSFVAPVGAAGITIWFDNPASCGGECLARIISFTNETVGDPGTPEEAITDELCITVLEECDDTLVTADGLVLAEDGEFIALE